MHAVQRDCNDCRYGPIVIAERRGRRMKGFYRPGARSTRLTGWVYAAGFVLATVGAVASLVWENEILPM